MGGFRPIQVVEQMVCRFSRSQGQKADLFSVSLESLLAMPILIFRRSRHQPIFQVFMYRLSAMQKKQNSMVGIATTKPFFCEIRPRWI
jgi:hypothetical protein